jgi:hypothetical protein
MHQLGTEEKAALLLAAADDDDDDYNNNHEMTNSPSNAENGNFPVVTKRPKTYHRPRTSRSHPVLYIILIVGAFLLGCVSGISIIFYRMSQDVEPTQFSNSFQTATKIDLSIRTKLFQSITKTNFMNLNR